VYAFSKKITKATLSKDCLAEKPRKCEVEEAAVAYFFFL